MLSAVNGREAPSARAKAALGCVVESLRNLMFRITAREADYLNSRADPLNRRSMLIAR